MGKTWTTRRRGDIADFNRWYTKGKEVWVINEHATNLAAQFEARTCSRRVATGRGLFGGEGKALLMTYGEVYETQPRGLRNLASREPQVAGPLDGEPFDRTLDHDEVEHMSKRAREASRQRDEDIKAGRRRHW